MNKKLENLLIEMEVTFQYGYFFKYGFFMTLITVKSDFKVKHNDFPLLKSTLKQI